MNWTRSVSNRLILYLIFVAAASPVLAGGGPLFVRNNSPVYLNLAAPPLTDFSFYDGDRWHLDVMTQYSSLYADSEVDGFALEQPVLLDMETLTISLRMERRVNSFSSFYVEIPTIANWKGAFDSLIENYHDIVGLSNGGRESAPDDRLAYRLGGLDIDSGKMGLGDIQMGFTIYKVGDISKFRFAFNVFTKLPTGSVADGLSSGSVDFGAGVAMSNRFDRFQLDYGLGMIAMGDPDPRFASTLDDLGYGYVACSGRIWREWEGVVQLLVSSSPFRTGYDRLDDYQALLTIGVRWRDWQFSFSEDVFTYTGPDITVSVSRRFRF